MIFRVPFIRGNLEIKRGAYDYRMHPFFISKKTGLINYFYRIT